jgi:hypothetical protein
MLTVYYALYLLQISGKEGQIKYWSEKEI